MEKLTFSLEVYEGPLDVLLNLITKHKLNIFDIEISKLLEQYMLFMENAHEQNLELSGEFLEMASRLIYIKTVSLLPQREEAEKMKKELEGILIEYSLCKKASALLAERYSEKIHVRKPAIIKSDSHYNIVHDPEKLVKAYSYLKKNVKPENSGEVIEYKINSVVKRKIVPVITKAVHILRELYSTGEVRMDRLYEGITSRSERVATFLAVLELTRYGRITISDDNMIVFMKDGVRKNWKSKKNSEH